MGDDYAGAVEALPTLKRDYWDPHYEAIPEIEGEGLALAFCCGTGEDMEMVLKKFKKGKIIGFDMAISGMMESIKRFAQVPEYAGRVAYMQADLGQPLRMIPDGGVRLITCRAGELFMPRAAIINMFGEAARVLEPGGKYVTNNLLMPFDDALK